MSVGAKRICQWKNFFGPLGEKKSVEKKICLSEKIILVGEFPLHFQEMSGHSLECKTGKQQRRKKTA